MSIKVVELFAGVGGFRLGLKESSEDFEFIWANQWEPGKKIQHAFNCYQNNFGNSEYHVNNDIKDAKFFVPNHDLLVGGFPCQDYSVASTGAKGIEGKKGVLWWEIAHIIKDKKPKYILLENVDRLLKSPTSQRGRDFTIMLKALDEEKYFVEWRVVNAADYGCKQKRRRVFIFARKIDLENSNLFNINTIAPIVFYQRISTLTRAFKIKDSVNINPKRVEIGNIDIQTISDNFSFNYQNSGYIFRGVIYTSRVDADIIKPVPLKEVLERNVDSKYYIEDIKLNKFKYLKDSKRIERTSKTGYKYFYSEGSISFPENLSLPSRTILTSETTLSRSTHVIEDLDTKKLRYLTEVECEILNGFPKNWTYGVPSRYRYFCMGNALVVDLVRMIGDEIIKIA